MVSYPHASIVHHFRAPKNPRIERTKKPTPTSTSLSLPWAPLWLAATASQDVELLRQANGHREGILDLSNGNPSHDTFGRVFSRLDPEPISSVLFILDPIGI